MAPSQYLRLICVFLQLFTSALLAPELSRPNVILVMTDDQDVELGSMLFMPKTTALLKTRGVTFNSGFVTTPICCPSRTSILTGLYAHNHYVFTNNQNCSGQQWRSTYEKKNFGVYLKNAGYKTAYFGKYLNEYDGSYLPPGWDEWMGLIKNSRFYNYTINYNGDKIKHGFDYEKDYFTDLIANDTIAFIKRHKTTSPSVPFLVVLSFPAPHGPEDPAPQYANWFENIETHRTAAWNYAPNPDKQWLLQHTGRMEPIHVVFTDVLQRRRLQTLQSVDENINRLFTELRAMGELSRTYFIYTSDHGYHLGQFGLVKGKNMPFEFDIRVPYFIRGPGLPKNLTISSPVTNLDIAPTILDIAGVKPPSDMDGRSLLPLLHAYSRQRSKTGKLTKNLRSVNWRHTVLIERGKMTKLTRIRDRLQKQRDKLSKEARVEAACLKPEFKDPCILHQQWKCLRDDTGKWRIFKCQEDLEISKECSCDQENLQRKRRQRRARRSKSERVSFRRVTTIAELDEEGQTVDVDEGLRERWENEFLQYLQQKEIVESGQWFQGVFDSKSAETSRSKRSSRIRRRKRKKERELNVGPMCSHSNTTVLCEPIVFEDSKVWEMHRIKVDDRIENLRKKLSAFKNMRRILKRGRPHAEETVPSQDSPGEKQCNCTKPQAHPLHNESDFRSVKERRRRMGRNRGDSLRIEHEGGSRKWLREDNKQNCNVPQMNCFVHGADHWRTPPLWPSLYGEFCFCQNSNNNTYWCLRTVNETHNFLYCEFITEFISYYDLRTDPYQLQNSVWSVPVGVLEQLSSQLERLRSCQGVDECEHYSSSKWDSPFNYESATTAKTNNRVL